MYSSPMHVYSFITQVADMRCGRRKSLELIVVIDFVLCHVLYFSVL